MCLFREALKRLMVYLIATEGLKTFNRFTNDLQCNLLQNVTDEDLNVSKNMKHPA